MESIINNLSRNIELHYLGWQNRRRISRLASQVSDHAGHELQTGPVIMFNVSSRLTGLSQNAAFSLLTAWSLRLAGVPVIQFVCKTGMKHCVLGTNRQDFRTPPPCQSCIAQSRRLWEGGDNHWFDYQENQELLVATEGLDVDALSAFEYPAKFLPGQSLPQDLPLGELVLPSIRWALRRHNLPDDEPTRYLLRSYMLSAYSIAEQFAGLVTRVKPTTVVIFNGILYPEASAVWVADKMNLRVITHEVGFQHLSTFFTVGQATAYPIEIPEEFELSAFQNELLDAYLQQRFQGEFSMAGIQFWPEMSGLDQEFLATAARFKQTISVFTNVVYDTSQTHANVVFPHMFAWLETILEVIRKNPDTLFVIRAHPDEMRPGTAKLSNESVQDWVTGNQVEELPNVVFINPQEYISSYELIQLSKFVLVYNSSIGLEAAISGKVVLCGGRARYTRYPTVYFPASEVDLLNQIELLLYSDEVVLPDEFKENARRFLYYQLFRVSLPLEYFLETIPRKGFVKLKSFSWERLHPENSNTMQVLYNGIINGEPFLRQDS